ncbi:MAG: adenine-specific methyltransferase EcoRI family protein [Fibrobacteraceae bacterium]|nr:adenine-specific methyltransferase EcoRI family protein [Fibrobacteraceae bacterium]
MANETLKSAKKNKNDEFYTQLSDIEKELAHYKQHFKGKTVLCNCDDPRVSNFFHYFAYNFEHLGLKRLITTCYKNQERDLFSQNDSESAIWLEYFGDKNGNRIPDPEEIGIHNLKGDGDFRSKECIELLKQADIVVTNPPFSLFREYVAQLVEFDKKFLIIGNKNAVTYKEIFSLFKENKIRIGYRNMNSDFWLEVPEGNSFEKVENGKKVKHIMACWYTNLPTTKQEEVLVLYKKYTPEEYPKYDNYDAIDVSKVTDIPQDYDGVIGVPITFLDKYNPEQFEIVGMISSAGYNKEVVGIDFLGEKDARPLINGKNIYARILIKKK